MAADGVTERMRMLAIGGGTDPCGAMAAEHLGVAGSRRRAKLAIQAARALDVPEEVALPWATCCELLHEASIVHDDLQDGDATRRGAPAAWVSHGPARAVAVGDLLLLLATGAVAEIPVPDALRWGLAHALATYGAATARGQALDLALSLRASGWADWEKAARMKTGSLFALPVHGAALLAGKSASEASAVAEAFARLGVVFQILDDVSDLYAERERRGTDLRAGRLSALTAAHLERAPHDVERLAAAAAPRANETLDALAAHLRPAARLARDRAARMANDAQTSDALAPVAEDLRRSILEALRALPLGGGAP